MSVQVSFKIADVAKIAKIDKEMAILKLPLQKNRQKPAKKGQWIPYYYQKWGNFY